MLSTPGPNKSENYVAHGPAFLDASFVCASCRRLADRVLTFVCPHKMCQRPPWMSYRAINAWADDLARSTPQTIQTEINGYGMINAIKMFSGEAIAKLRIPVRVLQSESISHVFIVADPNGQAGAGMHASSFGLVSAACVGSYVVLLGAENMRPQDPDERTRLGAVVQWILAHIARVREMFPSARLVFFCENNLGYTASLLAQLIESTLLSSISIYRPDGQQVRTVPGMKYSTCVKISAMLLTNALRVSSTFFSVSGDSATVRNLLVSQFEEALLVPATTPTGRPTVASPTNVLGTHNDLLMATLLAIYAILKTNTVAIFGLDPA